MIAEDVKLAQLKTYDDCQCAIDSIECDYANVVGGIKAWNSGYTTVLKQTAIKKIKSIENKMQKLLV